MKDWDQIVARHADAVWRTAYRLVGNRADADDIMQEAFTEAVGASARMAIRNWAAFLCRVATVRGLDRLRKRLAQKDHPFGEVALENAVSNCEAPDGPARRAELSGQLRRALGRLPAVQAEAFCLRHVEDMCYEEIADQLQVSVNSVGAILLRARERLRELLKEFGDAPVRCQP